METPWGTAQQQYAITDGVYEVHTAGHGGIIVAERVAADLLSQQAMDHAWKWCKWYAYEEDCAWAIFCLEQPDLYTSFCLRRGLSWSAEKIRSLAREMVELAYPDYLAAKDGVLLDAKPKTAEEEQE
jgi:hypothetical protein